MNINAIKELNTNINIMNVNDEKFKAYGNVLKDMNLLLL